MTAAQRFEQLYSAHAPRIQRLVARMVAAHDVDDVEQDIWLRIWQDLLAHPDRETARSWLDTIAADTCRRHRRNSARRQTVPLADHYLVSPDRQAADDRIELERLISHLPPIQQQVIRLHYFRGRTIQDIAGQLGLPAGTVKSHLFRARRKMKEIAEK